MAKHRRTNDEQQSPSKEGVARNLGGAYWSVDDCRWPALRPNLPAHLADLLAPPIVVGTAPVIATSRLTPPGARRAGVVPPPARPGGSDQRVRRSEPAQPAGGTAAGGRHRPTGDRSR